MFKLLNCFRDQTVLCQNLTDGEKKYEKVIFRKSLFQKNDNRIFEKV